MRHPYARLAPVTSSARLPPQRGPPAKAATVDPVEPRSCVVVEGDDRWPGTVLAWQKSPTGWRGLVRFSRVMPEGYPLTFEHWLPADTLEPA